MKLSGVYVYSIEEKRLFFSSGNGKRAFSFAIEPYFYVPAINNQRFYQVENWLASVEQTLSNFLKHVNEDRDGFLVKNKDEFMKLIIALFSLKNRVKYDIEVIKKLVIANPEMKKIIEIEDDRDVEIAVLENFINLTTEEAMEYSECEITIFRNEQGNLILGDRPFLHKILDEVSFIALSPYYFIALKKSAEPMYFYNDSLNEDVVDNYNLMVANNSRSWILSNNEEQLKKYVEFADSPKPNAEPYYQDIKFLKRVHKII